MNTLPAAAPLRTSRRFRVLRWTLIGSAACTLVLMVAVVHVVSLTRDAARLRDQMFEAFHTRPTSRIQITAGPILLGIVRTSLLAIDRIPPEAKLALRSVRNASVGIYGLPHDLAQGQAGAMFAGTEQMMRRRGWQRVVAVSDPDAQVVVFTPIDADRGSSQRVCVVVRNESHLVVVSGTIDPEPLVELVAMRGGLSRL